MLLINVTVEFPVNNTLEFLVYKGTSCVALKYDNRVSQSLQQNLFTDNTAPPYEVDKLFVCVTTEVAPKYINLESLRKFIPPFVLATLSV